jgi:hypothetical protein
VSDDRIRPAIALSCTIALATERSPGVPMAGDFLAASAITGSLDRRMILTATNARG